MCSQQLGEVLQRYVKTEEIEQHITELNSIVVTRFIVASNFPLRIHIVAFAERAKSVANIPLSRMNRIIHFGIGSARVQVMGCKTGCSTYISIENVTRN